MPICSSLLRTFSLYRSSQIEKAVSTGLILTQPSPLFQQPRDRRLLTKYKFNDRGLQQTVDTRIEEFVKLMSELRFDAVRWVWCLKCLSSPPFAP